MRCLAAILFLASLSLSSGATLYVSPSGSSTAPYDTWAKASTGLTLAATAANDGDTIYVTNGTYSRWTAALNTNFYWISMNGPAVTIVDGGGIEGPVVSPLRATISGFTLQNCTGIYAGVYLTGPAAVFSNCVFRAFKSTDVAFYGGAVEAEAGSTGTFYNCNFFDNTSSGGGGAIGVQAGSKVWLTDCTFSNNTSVSANGGALKVEGAVQAVRCTFSRNAGAVGQAVHIATGAGICNFTNSVFAYNVTLTGYGTVYALGTKANRNFFNCIWYGNQDLYYTLVLGQAFNCVFIGNRATDASADGCVNAADGGNNITRMNYPYDMGGGGQTNTSYRTLGAAMTLTACITNYPSFVDDYSATAAAANTGTNFVLGASGIPGFALQVGSPCIDTGSNFPWTVSAVDFATNARIANVVVDMGAYEYTVAGASANPDDNYKAALQWWRMIQ